MDSHPSTMIPAAAGRSHSSQSQSPSHSASASATSSIHKRKRATADDHAPPSFRPSSLSADTALTSNDDLESISARGGGASDDSDSDDAVAAGSADDDEEEEEEYENDNDRSSIRTFTAARLENAAAQPPRSSKLSKAEGVVKVEPPEGAKDGGNVVASGGGAAATAAGVGGGGGTAKEDRDTVKSIFTENIQTSGAYSAREEGLKRELKAENNVATVKPIVQPVMSTIVDNRLIGLKNIFARQLPNMPKEYIVRLVMDRNHKSVMVIRRNMVVGGITYRPYPSQKFGEIAFCAITADEQVKGYGTRLMNHLKQHARDIDGLTHFLTYADNNAVGYFIKQEKVKLSGTAERYIKEYDGGILMECKIDPKLPYTDLSTMIHRQRQAIDEKIRELSNCHTIYPGIDFQKKEAGIPKKVIKVDDIPGLREAGWTPDQYGHSRFKQSIIAGDGVSYQKSLTALMRSLLKTTHDHPDAWPFKEPVDARDVPDYYDIIKNPIDLKTMSKRVESEQYYVTFEMFVADVRRMFDNARTYNSPETIYYKCATRLESHFSSKVQAALNSGPKMQPP
ncbi:hypothetical protein Cgig2_016976 [Carnegiea gigantea]|uniref:histone acetyltransferase n=1 Tax=Carnegiea gigantea TaxID=171969 RepID=A0A9Q1KIK8_9CARY|nr:hypothetical protein Cgig2_016976 [Carnegiea gigantea]